MQDPDGPGPGRKRVSPTPTVMASEKTMTVRFRNGADATILQGVVHTDFERGWTTVVANANHEVVLSMPSSLIDAFGISSD